MTEVTQLPVDLGVPGWNALLSERQPSPALEQDIETDYLIVGAGFAGLSAARRLNQLDNEASVVILEASRVAEGPAGRNSGFMIDLPHVLSSSNYAGQAQEDIKRTRMNRAAIDFAGSMVKEFQMPGEAFVRSGKTNAAASDAGLRNNQVYASYLDSLDEPFRMLDRAEMRSLTGSSYYQGGLWTPGTVIIQPALYIRCVADGLAAKPTCRLYEQSAVISLAQQGDRWRAETRTGSVVAAKVILAINGLIESFGFYRQRLMHINLYASMSRELNAGEVASLGGESRWAFTPAYPLGSTVRRIDGRGGHRILIRNRCTYDPSMKPSRSRMSQVLADHDLAFRNRFPMLGRVNMEYRWSGRLCLSRNEVWAIGELDNHLYSACCQNGLGTTRGTIAGIIAAEMACGSTSDSLIPDYFEEEEPKKLLPEPFMSLGASSYLRFREWRAGSEL
ncbi:MAG: FAD-binding oxidoreductase [Gammaproteobacteria bacterium]|nr:FAD-binding oxidoreductase [Gammaproteobacteria bacterium]